MDENLSRIIELQKVDLAIKELQDTQTAIPRQIEDLKHDLESSKTVLSQYRRKLETVEKTRKSLERDIDGNNEKRKKYQTQLYAVKTNREYSSLLKEIESLNQQNLQIEEQIISTMEEVDDLRRTLALKEAEFKEEVKVLERRKVEKEQELEQVVAQLTEHRAHREELMQLIDPTLVGRYNKIAKVRHNAVVPIVKSACSGCYMKIRPQVLAKAKQSQSIVVCDNCSRILYVDPEES
ncbi:hypothetical protein JW905_14605 [bacterium]|nr:hypothetical protein [candidate division CSSED10-310 bacterium]